jgi:hypothetical protein
VDPIGSSHRDRFLNWKPDRSDLLISRRKEGCLLLLLLLGPWACGQRSCVVHHVHGPCGGAVAPDRHRGAMAERLVRAAVVVKGNPISKPLVQLAIIGIALEINILVLEAVPQPLDEDVVHPAAAAVHGDLDAGPFERTGEGDAGELAALVGVEDLWLAEARLPANALANA